MTRKQNTSKSPRPKKARQVKSNIKNMLIAFFDIDGLVHHEFVPTGQSGNKEFYKTVLQRLSDAVRRQCLRSGATGSCTTTTPLPTGLSPQKNFWRNKNIPSLPQPPYSPDLAPSEFFLLPQPKKTMKVRRFDYVEDIQANATRQLRAITKSDYQRCIRQWQDS
jgi:hypothetical protein